MPSRKQRRRRLKDRRHDMEYVWLDEEGNEIEVEDAAQPSRNGTSATARPAKGKAPAEGKPIQAGRRVIQPPSWQRAARRGLLFSPAIALFVYLLNRGLPLYGVVLNVLILLAFFVPFGYLMDRITYRAATRRLNKAPAKKTTKKA
jgi:hypothetical protein